MGGKNYNTTDAKLAGIDVQTSLLGKSLPVGWGRGRISCNLIDYVGFKAIPHTQKTGGKGAGSSSQTTYTYTTSIIMALCEGPIQGVRTVYKDATTLGSGTSSSLSKAGLSLATGTLSQAPWAYMTSRYPSHALGYSGIAYVYAQDYALNGSAGLPNHGFEVDFYWQTGANGDADPKEIIQDVLTNSQYGVTGWPSGLIGDLSDYSNYCRANNLLLSPVLSEPISGTDFINRVLAQTNSEAFWSEGVLKIKTYGDAPATGNGVSWTPNLTPIFDLDEDDFLEEVELEIVDQSDAYNYVTVEFLDRSNQYQPAPMPAQDLDNIVVYGLRKQDVEQFHDICEASIAQKVAQLRLQQTLYRREKYTFRLPQDFIALEPMDYVTLTTLVDGLALVRQLVIIESIDEDEVGNLQFVAWGVPGQTASAAQYTSHVGDGFVPNPEVSPGNVTGLYIMDAPEALTGLDPELWIAAAGNDPNWGGAQVWVSGDNSSYQLVGNIDNPATVGYLTAALPDSSATTDTTNTLKVDVSQCAQTMLSTSAANQANGATLLMVDGELISYRTATLTAANQYSLTTLGRGLSGTAHSSHASSKLFAQINDAIFRLPYRKFNFGSTMYVKLVSYNIYGRALQDLASVTAYSVALSSSATDWRDVAGLPGPPGADGASAYTWYAYADSADGTINFTTGAPGSRVYQGVAFNKSTVTESTNPADYTWTQYVGPPNFGLAAANGCEVAGSKILRRTAYDGSWGPQVYSTEGFTGGAFVAFSLESTGAAVGGVIIGLNTDPTATDWTTIDYAIYCEAGSSGSGNLYTATSGSLTAAGTYTYTDKFSVHYDGKNIRFAKNGTVFRTISAASGLRLFLDSAIGQPGARASITAWSAAGAAGTDGADGAPGAPGAPGADGADGAPGPRGYPAIGFVQDSNPGSGSFDSQTWYRPTSKEWYRWNASSSQWVRFLGTLSTLDLIASSALIADAVIINAKIADLTVDQAKIANLTLGSNKIQDNAISAYSSAGGTAGFTNTSWQTLGSLTLTPDSVNTKWVLMISGVITIGYAAPSGTRATVRCTGFPDSVVGLPGVPIPFSLQTVVSGLSSATNYVFQILASASRGTGDPHVIENAQIVALKLAK